MIGIDPEIPFSSTVERKRVENQQNRERNDFQNIFQRAVREERSEKARAESTPFVSEIRPVQFETRAQPSTTMIVNQVGHLIDTMEAYQQKLIENGVTLKDIEPFIDKLNNQSESLSAISKDVGMGDHLKSIVDQSLSIAAAEITRYQSGQYNDE